MKSKNLLRTVATLIATALLFISFSTIAIAAETSESSETTSTADLEAAYSYQVVTDTADMLTESEISEIEEKVAELSNYKVALYIEMQDYKTCSQKYTNDLSEKLYSQVFWDRRDGIMIAFSFYDEACGYYAVHCGANVSINENKVKNTINDTYHDYPTDREWVTGAFKQCVDYFKEAEIQPVVSPNKEKSDVNNSSFYIVLLLLLFAGMLAIIFYLAYRFRKIEKSFEDFKKQSNDDYIQLSREKTSIESQLSSARAEISTLNHWKEDASVVDVDIQHKIDDLHARQEAQEFDTRYKDTVYLIPIVENFNSLHAAMEDYAHLSDMAKGYVTLDINLMSESRQKAGELYAEQVTSELEKVQNECRGERSYESRLNNAVTSYSRIPLFVQLLIAESLISNVKRMQSDAADDARRYRNRQNSYHRSSTMHNSGSTFGGSFHGGSTFGGSFRGGH